MSANLTIVAAAEVAGLASGPMQANCRVILTKSLVLSIFQIWTALHQHDDDFKTVRISCAPAHWEFADPGLVARLAHPEILLTVDGMRFTGIAADGGFSVASSLIDVLELVKLVGQRIPVMAVDMLVEEGDEAEAT